MTTDLCPGHIGTRTARYPVPCQDCLGYRPRPDEGGTHG